MSEEVKNPRSDADEQRAKFKAALDAKNHKPGHTGSHPHATGAAAKDPSGRSGGKREFRRKSGG